MREFFATGSRSASTLISFLKLLTIGLGIGAALVPLLVLLRDATPCETTGAVSWLDYWLNRYQTLLTGLAAIATAWVTFRVMRYQIDATRADEADRALASYAVALTDVMDKYLAAVGEHENRKGAEEALRALKNATDDPTIRTALIDPAFGKDQGIISMFLHACKMYAAAQHQSFVDLPNRNAIWPLYDALRSSITRRRALLRKVGKASSLYGLATIDRVKLQEALAKGEAPVDIELPEPGQG
jgi:hypothetical protein